MINLYSAINALVPNAECIYGDSKITQWHDKRLEPTADELSKKLAELQDAEPMRLLRIERNQLLQETDWRMTIDYPYDDQAEWASYRTKLRDLPMTSEPTLNENGNLIIDWPAAPGAV
tara:strand:- start:278 stop:631 length:354 start_codon:yes stop_codon:yes gene_type:complete